MGSRGYVRTEPRRSTFSASVGSFEFRFEGRFLAQILFLTSGSICTSVTRICALLRANWRLTRGFLCRFPRGSFSEPVWLVRLVVDRFAGC